MKKLSILLLMITFQQTMSQSGTIKGVILDKQSEIPLIGATVELLEQDNSFGVVSDLDGRFILEDTPIGRQIIRISYIGYESLTLPNIEVTAGKDVFLTISLLESFNQLDEIVLTNNTTTLYLWRN